MKLLRALVAALLSLSLLSGCGGGGKPAAGGGAELNVFCFSAGKADAFLLYTARSAVVIDCGEKGFGGDILDYMESVGLDRLDCLIISHFDKDHVGGAAKILNNIPVGTVLQSNHPKDSEEYGKYVKALNNAGLEPVTVRETLAFTLDGVDYSVDPPRKDDYDSDGSNNSSLIVSVRNGENDLLFTGDAQDERLAEFISANRTGYEFLKVPYHGHWQKMLPELVASVRPSIAVVTSSDREPEDPATLALLAEAGAEIYLTREGAALLRCDGKTMRMEPAAEQAAAA
ncbi:MAG: MBL fold metallo-hydrolase [Oscillospiraceae bacterium]|nr:MBL fold metallo-hydrolase [Oscillospiraceae bacterium]